MKTYCSFTANPKTTRPNHDHLSNTWLSLRSFIHPVLSNITILNSPAILLALKPFKMPRLRQITCQVEWPEPGLKFEEYGTVYGDGLVETFIAVPDRPQPFSIHLTSKGYIAEGLAMLVYMDGEYQCNRNRLHLKPPKKGQARDQTNVDFRLRQKEKTIGGGSFIGRDWRFDSHNIG